MYVIRKEFSNIFKVLMELNEVSHFKTLTHFSEVHEVEKLLKCYESRVNITYTRTRYI